MKIYHDTKEEKYFVFVCVGIYLYYTAEDRLCILNWTFNILTKYNVSSILCISGVFFGMLLCFIIVNIVDVSNCVKRNIPLYLVFNAEVICL